MTVRVRARHQSIRLRVRAEVSQLGLGLGLDISQLGLGLGQGANEASGFDVLKLTHQSFAKPEASYPPCPNPNPN